MQKRQPFRSFRLGKHGVTREQWEEAISRGLRWCCKCKRFLEPNAFTKGQQSKCRECGARDSRDYYYANHEAEKKRRRGRYALDPKFAESQRIASRRRWASLSAEEKRLYHRHFKLKSKYGISAEIFDEMVVKQRGLCKLCENPPPRGKILSIDHLHGTKTVRGLLCNNCNVLVGFVEKNLAMLEKVLAHIGQ